MFPLKENTLEKGDTQVTQVTQEIEWAIEGLDLHESGDTYLLPIFKSHY